MRIHENCGIRCLAWNFTECVILGKFCEIGLCSPHWAICSHVQILGPPIICSDSAALSTVLLNWLNCNKFIKRISPSGHKYCGKPRLWGFLLPVKQNFTCSGPAMTFLQQWQYLFGTNSSPLQSAVSCGRCAVQMIRYRNDLCMVYGTTLKGTPVGSWWECWFELSGSSN